MSKSNKYAKLNPHETYLKPLIAKNSAQQHYLDTIREATITFCAGPAGTGKTLLASYIALEALLNKEVEKIILTRPIVATEDIGFLPGDMQEKIHPYMLPLLDSLEDHIGPIKLTDLLGLGKIEIVPLAYMRGRSLSNSFLVLDESQNTTKEQMKMFLTRLGFGSKMVITGDASQTDLPGHIEPGFTWAVNKLKGVDKDIAVVEFSSRNIVRNPLIERMLTHLESPPTRSEKLYAA